jgi:hypothetical protein
MIVARRRKERRSKRMKRRKSLGGVERGARGE